MVLFTVRLIALGLALSGCSIESSITALSSGKNLDPISLARTEPDFVSSEKVNVATPGGYAELTGSFGEITTEVALPNGIVIEGAFYQ